MLGQMEPDVRRVRGRGLTQLSEAESDGQLPNSGDQLAPEDDDGTALAYSLYAVSKTGCPTRC